MLKTPILFLIFNRPDTTEKVFEKIREQKPKYFFIAADGPRTNKPGEIELCEKTREILKKVDWDCEVKTLFRVKNLGCKKAVGEAITWFFDNVEEGIIIEDDCLPSSSFFPYCENLLNYYRNNQQVMHIGGISQIETYSTNASYHFSPIAHVWGWASWKRAWNHFNLSMNDFDPGIVKKMIPNKYQQKDWITILKNVKNENIDTWDFIWQYALFKQKGLAIVPHKNLVYNIGFGKNATHTTDFHNTWDKRKLEDIDFHNIIHPEEISYSDKILIDVLKIHFGMNDRFTLKRYPIYHKIIREIKRLF